MNPKIQELLDEFKGKDFLEDHGSGTFQEEIYIDQEGYLLAFTVKGCITRTGGADLRFSDVGSFDPDGEKLGVTDEQIYDIICDMEVKINDQL